MLAFSADGERVLLDSADSTAVIRAIDGRTGDVVLRGHTGRVRAAAFSANGSRALTGSDDGTARLWQTDGQELGVLRHPGNVLAVAFAADGDRVVTGSADGAARVWQADGTDPITVMQFGKGAVVTAAFSSGGDRVLAVTQEQTEAGSVRAVWVRTADGSDGREALLTGSPGDRVHASFSPDGRRVVAVTNRHVHLWFEGEQEPQVLDAERGLHPEAFAFSGDGSQVVTIDHWGNMHTLPICSPQECIEALWRATSYCLSVAERRDKLGENVTEAAKNAAACQKQVDGLMAQGAYR